MTFLTIPTGTFTHPGTAVLPAVNDGSAAAEAAKIALFQTMFSGEIYYAFRKNRATEGRITRKEVKPGAESALFRQVGKGTVTRHLSGQDIELDTHIDGTTKLSNQVDVGDFKIFLSRPLLAATSVDEWENLRNVHDMRGPIAQELAKDLADEADKEAFLMMIKAAQGGLTQTPNFISQLDTSGLVLTDAAMATNGSTLMENLRLASLQFKNKNMWNRGKAYVAVSPNTKSLLVQQQELLNRELGNTSNGIFSEGTVMKAWGMEILETTQISDLVTTVGNLQYTRGVHGETLDVNAANTVFVAWMDAAIGEAVAMNVSVREDYDSRKFSHRISARFSHGLGAIYPAGCVQGRTSA